jgi:pimeloyl-ACP methyl ester carboxylesterase
VSTRADLVQSWVTDAAGLGDLDFEWHEFAKIWQTPVAGEEFFAAQLALSPEEQAGVFEGFGVPHDQAMKMAGLDQTMADCILALYRSATNVGKEWAPEFKHVPKPGMVIIPAEDPFLAEKLAAAAAANAGARTQQLAGVGHWWMLQDPAKGAAMLEEFWASLS